MATAFVPELPAPSETQNHWLSNMDINSVTELDTEDLELAMDPSACMSSKPRSFFLLF